MCCSFAWYSSSGSEFNLDFQVSVLEEDPRDEILYNFHVMTPKPGEMPGASVFIKGEDGEIYHSYSIYSRGLEDFNMAYRILDMVPLGRDEDSLDWPQQWVRHHDRYPR